MIEALKTHGLLALGGGIVHALIRWRAGQTKGFLDLIALAAVASFSGVIFGLTASHFLGPESYLVLAITGAGAFLGAEGLSALALQIQRAFPQFFRCQK